MGYKCVIFDCDGILVDSETISARILQQMAMDLGFDLDYKTAVEQFAGASMTENLEFIRKHIKIEIPADFENEFRKRTYASFKRDLKPVDGIHDILDKVKVPFCVASSGPSEKIRLTLTTVGLINRFEGRIFSSYEIGTWKPEPGIFLHAAKNMGFLPGECVVVEDSTSGIRAASAGGFKVYALAGLQKKSKFESLGARVFHHMKELEPLLQSENLLV